jgi:hypothetical protein
VNVLIVLYTSIDATSTVERCPSTTTIPLSVSDKTERVGFVDNRPPYAKPAKSRASSRQSDDPLQRFAGRPGQRENRV